MDKVVKFENSERIQIEASEWIAKLDRKLDDTETDMLRTWLAQSARHRSVLMQMASLWDRMDDMGRLSSLFPNAGDATDMDTAAFQREKKGQFKSRFARKALAYAASFLVVVLSMGWFISSVSPSVLSPSVLAFFGVAPEENGLFETSLGEHSSVILADGSELILNTNTLVKVKYQDDARLFYLLRGEIHIDVAHDKRRPLSVIAGVKVVQAVGTAFNVQRVGHSSMELIVTDGKVLVSDREMNIDMEDYRPPSLFLKAEKSVAITKGEKMVFGSGDTTVNTLDKSDIEASLSWREGNLVFRGETLEQALAEISRYTEVEFYISDESIKRVRIAGVFKAGDVNGLLETLKHNFNIEADKLGKSTVRLRSS